jgi:LAGLIDADG endonuclease
MAELDQLNVATERYIRDTPALVDDVFQADPLLAYLKLNVREDFPGGTLIQEGFINTYVKRHGNVGKSKPLLIDLKSEMTTRANPMELERAWAAGLLDGEGCFSITSCTNKRKLHLRPVFSACITVSMVRAEAITKLQQVVGGTLGRTRDEYGAIYQWRAYGSKARAICEMLLPYLVLKRRQAELIVAFQATKGQAWEKVSIESYAKRAAMLTEITVLNRTRTKDAERASEEAPVPKQDGAVLRTDGNDEPSEADGNVRPASVN